MKGNAIKFGRRILALAASMMVIGSFDSGYAEEDRSMKVTVEAEMGDLLGGAKQMFFDGESCVGNLYEDGSGVKVQLTVPESGFYDVVVTMASEGGYKENYIEVDGERMGVVVTNGTSWHDDALERVYMEKGSHEVAVMKYWGWSKINAISVIPSAELPDDIYDVSPVLVNPNANESTCRLMAYLCDCYGKVTLTGQYCETGMYGNENAAIFRATGEYPAILGMDLSDYSPSRVAHGAQCTTVDKAIIYGQKGGIVTFTWHWNAPEKYLKPDENWYAGFNTNQTTIDLAAIMDGRDPEGYQLLLEDMDTIAAQLKRLQDADVPVLWRPLHEASGGWFWWGGSGPEACKKLYWLMYDRFTNVHGLNNLIWIWNGQDPAWYPGDEYVDMLSIDLYPGERVYTSQSAAFLELLALSDTRKIIALSENGSIPDPDLVQRDQTVWSFYATWGGDFVTISSGLNKISEKYTELDMLKKVFSHEKTITRSELPDLKTYPLPEEK